VIGGGDAGRRHLLERRRRRLGRFRSVGTNWGNPVTYRLNAAAACICLVSASLLGEADVAAAAPYNGCSISANKPHESSGSPGHIVAKAKFGCDEEVSWLEYDIRLEKRSGGTWVAVRTTSSRLYGSDTRAPVSRPIVRQVSVVCQTGRFRTAARITASQGGEVKRGGWDRSPEVVDPCDRGGGGGGSWLPPHDLSSRRADDAAGPR
jgi:hypothetical protein